jgi:thiol-disulfide isomerase/thioredoxin
MLMTRTLSLGCIWLLTLLAFAEPGKASGITFFQGDFEAVKAEAARTGRLIFMDAYATWCAPCRTMAQQVFTDPEVGDYFNRHFINYQLDMEQGEGPQIGQRFDIQAYPTLLFLKADGKRFDYVQGARTAEQLLRLGKRVLEPGYVPLPARLAQFRQGNRDREFLYALLVQADEAQVAAEEALAAYISQLKVEELVSPRNWDIFERHIEDTESPLFQYVEQHHPEFELLYGKQTVAEKLGGSHLKAAYHSFDRQDEAAYNRHVAAARQYDSPWVARELLILELGPFAVRQDWLAYVRNVDRLVDEFRFDDGPLLNDFAWTLYKAKAGNALLDHAAAWSAIAVRQEPCHAHCLTQACILHETGQAEQARAAAAQARDWAEREGITASPFLQEILGK